MENISVKCPHCGAAFTVPAFMAGQEARCSCGRAITICAAPQAAPYGGQAAPASPRPVPPPKALKSAKWYISEDGLSAGPFSFDEMRGRVARGQLGPDRLVYAAPLGQWKRVAAVPELQPGHGARPDGEEHWYVSVKGTRYGPYRFQRMLGMIQEGRLSPRSLVWTRSLGDWRRLGRVGRFASALQSAQVTGAVGEMWYYVRDGDRVGPLWFEQVIVAAREGKLRPQDRVWSNRLDKWVDVASVPELAEAAVAAAEDKGRLWYYRTRRAVQEGTRQHSRVGGPVGLQELRRLVETGQVRPGDTVFYKGLGTWKDICDVPELQDAIAATVKGLGRADRTTEQWYYRVQGAPVGPSKRPERGPVTERFLAELVSKGSVKAGDLVWGPGSAKWRAVRDVSELARYLPLSGKVPSGPERVAPARTEAEPTEHETTDLEVQLAESASLFAGRRMRIALAVVAALILVFALALFIEHRLSAGRPPEGGPAEPSFRLPEEPATFVEAWLELFLTDADRLAPVEREIHQQRLRLFYAQGYMDAYAEDVRSGLRAAGGASLEVKEVKCGVLRADDGEHFCYHAPFTGPPVRVRAARPLAAGLPEAVGAEEVEKAFARDAFRELRCFQVAVRGQPLHPSALVLVRPASDGAGQPPLQVVAFGRLAHVGAVVSGVSGAAMRAVWMTGYKSSSMSETDSLLRLGVSAEPGLEGAGWVAYGELMSVDGALVPVSIQKRRQQAAGRSGEWILVMGESAAVRAGVSAAYGPPERSQALDLPAAGVLIVAADPERDWPIYARLEADYYGLFGVASEPESGKVVGFLFGFP